MTVQFEILFFIKFYKNAEFCFTFFLSYVVSTQNTSLLFWGKGQRSLTEGLRSWIDGGNTVPCRSERLLSAPRRDSLPLTQPPGHTPRGVEQLNLILCPLPPPVCLQHRLNSLRPRDLWGPDPRQFGTSTTGSLDFTGTPAMGPGESSGSFSRLWIFRLTILPFHFIS